MCIRDRTLDEQSLLTQLNKKRIEIENAIQAEREKLRKIELAKSEIQGGKGELHYNISVKSIPAYQVLSLRKVVPNYYSEGDLWKELSALDRKSTRLNSSHLKLSRMPSSA